MAARVEARLASTAAQPRSAVLPVGRDTVRLGADVAPRHGSVRRRYYDARIAAGMRRHGMRRICTESARDFACSEGIEAANPVAWAPEGGEGRVTPPSRSAPSDLVCYLTTDPTGAGPDPAPSIVTSCAV